MRLELSRCTVRSWEPADAADLAAGANDREVWINLRDAFPHPYTKADARRFIRRCLARDPQTVFAIEVEGRAAGSIGVRPGEDVERVSAEIGYWLARPHWGQGIMTEALRAVTEHAIRTFALTRVFALPFEWNLASARVLEKAGYVLEGRLHRSAIKDGKIVDQLQYAYVVEAR